MERAEAEAIYDAGREACVEFLLELSARYEAQIARLQERIRRLEEQARRSSRNSHKTRFLFTVFGRQILPPTSPNAP
jgi:phage shock protein A